MTTFITLWVPTVDDVAAVAVGEEMADAFGSVREVTEVTYRGVDIKGRPVVCFRTQFGPTSEISGSLKAGELVRNTLVTKYFNSSQLWLIEQDMIAKGERTRMVEVG